MKIRWGTADPVNYLTQKEVELIRASRARDLVEVTLTLAITRDDDDLAMAICLAESLDQVPRKRGPAN